MLVVIIVLVVCGIILFSLIGTLIWRRYGVALVDFYHAIHDERRVAAVFWLVVTLIYIGLLVIGGYLESDVFLVVVGGCTAGIFRLGKRSIQFLLESETAHQVPIIAIGAVAVFSWLWPNLAFVGALTVVFVAAFFFTDASERWEEFDSHWGRKVLYHGVRVSFALMLVWTVFKLSSPPLAQVAIDAKRSAEQAVVAYFKNPTPVISRLYEDTKALFAHAISEAAEAEAKKPAPASMPASDAWAKKSSSASKPAKSNQNLPTENIGIATRPPTVDEVVSGKAKPPETPPASSPASKPAPANEDAVQRELREAFEN